MRLHLVNRKNLKILRKMRKSKSVKSKKKISFFHRCLKMQFTNIVIAHDDKKTTITTKCEHDKKKLNLSIAILRLKK